MNLVHSRRRYHKGALTNPYLTIDMVAGEPRYRTADKVVIGQCKTCLRRNVNVLNLLCQECFLKERVADEKGND